MGPREQTPFSGKLRANSTDAERAMWARLRGFQTGGLKSRRQQPIGQYVADFVCFEKKLVVELDGGQHNTEAGKQADGKRTAWLESQGFRVLRAWDNEVLTNMEGVLEAIAHSAEGRTLT